QNDGFEALRPGINRRRETSRSCADNHEIAFDFAFVLASRIAQKAGHAGNLAQGRVPERHAVGGDKRWQIAPGQMEALAQGLTIWALRLNQPVRNMILVEEIVDLISVPRAVQGDNAQAGKLAVAPESLPSHDESAHDWL